MKELVLLVVNLWTWVVLGVFVGVYFGIKITFENKKSHFVFFALAFIPAIACRVIQENHEAMNSSNFLSFGLGFLGTGFLAFALASFAITLEIRYRFFTPERDQALTSNEPVVMDIPPPPPQSTEDRLKALLEKNKQRE